MWSLLAVLGHALGLCWRSSAALGAYVGGLGQLLGHMLAVLACFWDLCWLSWAALGAYVGGLGQLFGAYVGGLESVLGPTLAVLGRSGTHVGGLVTLLGHLFAVLTGNTLGFCIRSLAALGWDPCGRSWEALGDSVCDTGGAPEALWAALGSWGLCGRSWAAPGSSLGGPGGPGRAP